MPQRNQCTMRRLLSVSSHPIGRRRRPCRRRCRRRCRPARWRTCNRATYSTPATHPQITYDCSTTRTPLLRAHTFGHIVALQASRAQPSSHAQRPSPQLEQLLLRSAVARMPEPCMAPPDRGAAAAMCRGSSRRSTTHADIGTRGDLESADIGHTAHVTGGRATVCAGCVLGVAPLFLPVDGVVVYVRRLLS